MGTGKGDLVGVTDSSSPYKVALMRSCCIAHLNAPSVRAFSTKLCLAGSHALWRPLLLQLFAPHQ